MLERNTEPSPLLRVGCNPWLDFWAYLVEQLDVVRSEILGVFALIVLQAATRVLWVPATPAIDFDRQVVKGIRKIVGLLAIQVSQLDKSVVHKFAQCFSLIFIGQGVFFHGEI